MSVANPTSEVSDPSIPLVPLPIIPGRTHASNFASTSTITSSIARQTTSIDVLSSSSGTDSAGSDSFRSIPQTLHQSYLAYLLAQSIPIISSIGSLQSHETPYSSSNIDNTPVSETGTLGSSELYTPEVPLDRRHFRP